MVTVKNYNLKEAADLLKNGGIGVLPTDTIYGLVGSAFSKKAVAKIYRIKKRSLKKAMIILISSFKDLESFGINLSALAKKRIRKFWPGPVSVILPCPSKKFFYLHHGLETLAFRWPKPKWLLELLRKTGPLVAPSANVEGRKPAETIAESRIHFDRKVNFYCDAGRLSGLPSTLVEIRGDNIIVARKGRMKVTSGISKKKNG